MPSNIIYVGVPGFTAFTLINLGQSALTVLANNDFLSGLSTGTPPNGVMVGQVAVVFAVIFSLMLVGMACMPALTICHGYDISLTPHQVGSCWSTGAGQSCRSLANR